MGAKSVFATNTSFQVNVKESVSISITTPEEWGSGGSGDFMRNQITVNVATNSKAGFTASMFSKANTNLVNLSASGNTIPTLESSATRAAFPANYWGYSLGEYTINGVSKGSDYQINGNTYGETADGNQGSNYYPLVATSSTPITIMSGNVNETSGTQNVYFGAKGDSSKASGIYSGTIVISVVTGQIDSSANPIAPANPANPGVYDVVAYSGAPTGGAHGTTTYTYAAGNTTTTEVSDGDNRSLYDAYADPQGETEDTYSNIANYSPAATALAVTAAVAATSGAILLASSKYNNNKDEENDGRY